MSYIKNGVMSVAGIIYMIMMFMLPSTYLHGIYKLAFDNSYSSKELLIGMIIFPYPIYISLKEIHKIITVPAADRKLKIDCLEGQKEKGIARKRRLESCECLVKTKNPYLCTSQN